MYVYTLPKMYIYTLPTKVQRCIIVLNGAYNKSAELARTIYIIYGIYLTYITVFTLYIINGIIYTVFLAGKSPNIRSYTLYIYGSGQPYKCAEPATEGRGFI